MVTVRSPRIIRGEAPQTAHTTTDIPVDTHATIESQTLSLAREGVVQQVVFRGGQISPLHSPPIRTSVCGAASTSACLAR